jgi:hypothetical protein
MRTKRLAPVLCILVCMAIAIPMVAQQRAAAPDPLSGTWTGDWGPGPGDRNTVSVDLKWDGKALTGTVKSLQPSRPDVALQKSTYTAASNAVHMEAELKSPRDGSMVHFIIDGKLANGTMTGSWNHDTTKGDFKLTKK